MKRFFDIVISALALLFLSPIIFMVRRKVANNLGSPVLFKQKRPGLNGDIFEMLKFRSMLDAIDENGNPLPDSKRLTPFGKKLRATSLDELPGLWNVLKGDMSLVGPRPLLVEYLPLYSKEQAKRHNVRPGITGWAQVNGRNAISWDQKFKLDVWYVENQSFWLDIKILFFTVKKVLIRDGITAENSVTAEPFKGSVMKKIEGKIYDLAKIISIENLRLGARSQIDDFCFINAGDKCTIGRNVHIASFTSIVGGGECYIDNFAGLSSGCRLITATDDFTGPYLTNPTVPSNYTNVKKGVIHIGKHAIIGTNSIIFPNVTIGEGCAVGAGSIIRKDLEAWTIYAMVNGKLKALKKRPETEILKKEEEYLGKNNA